MKPTYFPRSLVALVVGTVALLAATPAMAQGLIWSLPEDGTSIRYEGEYSETLVRENDTVELGPWIRHLTISSVGTEMVDDPADPGKKIPARWIELKVTTGRSRDGRLDPGPLGERIYKVLVPEAAVLGREVDDDGIPVAYIPILRGYRKIGQGDVQQLSAPVLQIYPVISLLRHYPQLQPSTEPEETIRIGTDVVSARKFTGRFVMESRTSRSTNTGGLWRSDEVPFGLAKWTVTIVREQKDAPDPRSAFKRYSEIRVQMQAVEIRTEDVRSELATPESG
ncbi:MAG: hypothetical protein D6741_03065 [Planctomycetota bacterium]|nr:MAG: hypothetical protein D6741_03065 [Planctomycetota bacterium]